jgi:serine protease Do
MIYPSRSIRRFAFILAGPLALAITALAQNAVPEIKVDNAPVPQSATTYAPVVDKVAPCIVTISTSRNVRLGDRTDRSREDFFRRFFGIPDENEEPADRTPRENAPRSGSERQRRQPAGLGSGVIVTAEGHILTNNHVIEGADDIIVTLGNDKHEYKAKKIGGDPDSDIAVLKIDGAGFPAITFTDSEKLRIGDVVLAVGNPFGLTRSVSAGIVSSTGRGNMNGVRMAVYENYIQTDASINPGNSGGALVDIQGRLVGINTSIFSRSGGNEGIGFAVPSNLARGVMESILKHGRVVRGFLGINLQDLTEDLAAEMKAPNTSGALVTQVYAASPAAKAGIARGDVVVEVDGRKIRDGRDLQLLVAGFSPGTKVSVKALREGKEKLFSIELGELNRELASRGGTPAQPDPDPDVLDGVTVADLDAQTRKEFSVPEDVKGALVTQIDPDSPSAEAGIKVGDVIQEVGRQPVTSAEQAVKLSEKVKTEKKVLLLVSSRGAARFVTVERKE